MCKNISTLVRAPHMKYAVPFATYNNAERDLGKCSSVWHLYETEDPKFDLRRWEIFFFIWAAYRHSHHKQCDDSLLMAPARNAVQLT